MKTLSIAVVVGVMLLMTACSSTNLNAFRFSATGLWVKGSPLDTQTPGRVELGAGYTSFTLWPLQRGQGFTVDSKTYELVGGRLVFSETITVTPLETDALVKLSKEPASFLKIPYLVDWKTGDPAVTTLTVTPVEK